MAVSLAQPPFSDTQWQDVQQLLKQLDDRQVIWLSGYLAGRGRMEPVPAAAAAPRASAPLLIGYGSETGNCRQLAQRLATLAGGSGIAAEVQDLGRLKLRQLTRTPLLVVICSTHGDGDPPEPMIPFFEALGEEGAPRLPDLQFAVLALGDSTYEHFCATGRQLDERLEALGARRLLARSECDVDFAAPAKAWMEQLLPLLPGAGQQPVAVEASAPRGAATTFSLQQPLAVEVLENLRLSAADDPAPVHHLELALETADFQVLPGDAVGVLAHNPPALVAAILDGTGLPAEQPVVLGEEAMPLVQVLREHRDLTVPSPRFLEYWAAVSGAGELAELVAAERGRQRAFLRERQVLDLIRTHPGRAAAQDFVDALRPLQPRLYDVANSLAILPDELHLTVKRYRYAFGERTEAGIASAYLLDLSPGETVTIYPHANKRFRLPEEQDAPLILIADGTGAAPYRAFVQALEARQQRPDCWLVFGEASFEEDFFYQLDWQQAREAGVLSRFDPVFHTRQPGRELADALIDRGDELRAWLARGAHLYLCGDKELLTRCEQRLQAWFGDASGWRALDKAKRLHRNLY